MAEPWIRSTGGRDVWVRQRGQAQLELIAAVPALVAVGLVLLQLMSVGYAQSLADGSAEAGAIALAAGSPVEEAALAALPGWASRRVEVDVSGGKVAVDLRPPAVLPVLARKLAVSSSAWARPANGAER